MEFNNKFLIIWWSVVLFGLICYLYSRFNVLINNKMLPFDYLMVIMFLLLVLYPLITEMNIFGLSIKKDISKIDSDINELKGIISYNQNNNAQTTNLTFSHGHYLSDHKMDEVLRDVDQTEITSESSVERIKEIMYIRYLLEKEIKRISIDLLDMKDNIRMFLMVRRLIEAELLSKDDFNIIMEIYNLTSKVIHAGSITERQEKFVLSAYKPMLEKLERIK